MGFYLTTPEPAVLEPQPRKPETAYPRPSCVGSGMRFYNPGMGRWVNRDPVFESGFYLMLRYAMAGTRQDANSIGFSALYLHERGKHSYLFVNGDPIGQVDWIGLFSFHGNLWCSDCCDREIRGCEDAGAAQACCIQHEDYHQADASPTWCRRTDDCCSSCTHPNQYLHLDGFPSGTTLNEVECPAHTISLDCCRSQLLNGVTLTLRERCELWTCWSVSWFWRLSHMCHGAENDPRPGPHAPSGCEPYLTPGGY